MDLDTKPQIFKSQNIIIDNITFKKIYSIGNNIYNQPIKYILKDLIIQTPIIYIPFGINSYNNKKYLDISLLNIESDTEMIEFKKFICNINELVIKKIKTIRTKNHKNIMSFKNSLKKTSNSFFPDRVRLSISESILVYNDYKRKISFDCIQPKIYCKMLISPKCIWYSKKDFGIVWNILQVKIYDKLILDEYSFIDNHPNKETINSNFENDERYKKYFRMIKMGVPSCAVKHKMITDAIDPSILDCNQNTLPEHTNKIPEHTNKIPEHTNNNMLNELYKKINLNKINGNNNNKSVFINSKKTIITKDMILGVKLNKSKPVKKKIIKDNKHFKTFISLDEIKSIRNNLNKINYI